MNPSTLIHHIHAYGWCDHATTLVYTNSPTRIEKGLLAMEALEHSCDFTGHATQLHQLAVKFRELLANNDSEQLIESLLEHCNSLLARIRVRNRDL